MLNEIKDACPSFDTVGFYNREIRLSPAQEVELRLLTKLDPDKRRLLANIVRKCK